MRSASAWIDRYYSCTGTGTGTGASAGAGRLLRALYSRTYYIGKEQLKLYISY